MVGPKMYNAQATLQDDDHHGSTRLHLDLTDTINIMIWAANLPDGKPGYTIWHIFAAADLPLLHLFFIEQGIFKGMGNSVHSQTIWVTPTLLQHSSSKYGIKPYVI